MFRAIFTRTAMSSVAAAVAVIAAAPADAQSRKAGAVDWEQALAGPHRSEANKARDVYRKPRQTLEFCGLKPTMTVVEISPGGGWYTEVIAPVMKDKGTFYVAHANPASSERAAKAVADFQAKLASSPVYSNVKLTSFGKDHYDKLAPAGSADMVLTFRNVHNWHMNDFGPQAFKAFYDALKPGGVLCLEEHRLPEGRPDEMMKTSGYMKVSAVRQLAEAAGFRFAGSSEVNANPKDTADHPKGVWNLPPTFRDGDQDRAKYAAIGESDRMTLKFVKADARAEAKPKRRAAMTGTRLAGAREAQSTRDLETISRAMPGSSATGN